MAAAAGRRRRQRDAAEDTFITWVLRLTAWAQHNTRALIFAVIAVAIFAGGVLYYRDYRSRVNQAAANDLRTLESQVQSDGGPQAIDGLRSFLTQFGGTRYAREARVLLAQQLLEQGRAADAIGPAQMAAKDLGKDPVATRAALLLAAAQEEAGDTAAAIQVYERIGARAQLTSEKAQGLEGAARLLAASGQVTGAIDMYDKLIALMPEESPRRGVYAMRKAELEARRDSLMLSGS